MITWLQRKHKYLMITMWISGISFIAAGFVGWGSYSFKNNDIKKIGNETITQEELREATENVKRNSGIKDEKIASKFAMEMLIKSKEYKDYMKKNGYLPQNKEVLEEISKVKIFQDEKGNFNKDKYFEILKDNRISPKKFEEKVRETLYTKYISDMFENKRVLEIETENIAKLYNRSLDIKYSIIDVEPKENVSKKEIGDFYNKNINKYKLPELYDIEYYEIKENNLENDAEKYKKRAQLEYIKIKKGKSNLTSKNERIENDGSIFPKTKISQLELNRYSKPILSKGIYYVIKLNSIEKRNRGIEEVEGEISKEISINKTAEKMREEYANSDLNKMELKEEFKGFNYKSGVEVLGLEESDAITYKKRVFGYSKGKRDVYYNKREGRFLIYEVSNIETRETNSVESFEITKNISELKSRIYMNYFEKELEKGYDNVGN